MKDARELKKIETKLRLLREERETIRQQSVIKQQELSAKDKEIKDTQKLLESKSSDKKLKLTEHAVLRYLERVKNLDLEEIENEILTEDFKKQVDTFGGTLTYNGPEFSAVLKDFKIITITV